MGNLGATAWSQEVSIQGTHPNPLEEFALDWLLLLCRHVVGVSALSCMLMGWGQAESVGLAHTPACCHYQL